MILQALAEYYERLSEDPSVKVAPPGWFFGTLDYLVVLDLNGCYVAIERLKENEDNGSTGRITLLPYLGKQAMKHTNSGNDANLLWDNSSFVFGLGKKGETKLRSFVDTIETHLGSLGNEAIDSVLLFLKSGLKERKIIDSILNHEEFGEDISRGRARISFSVQHTRSKFVFTIPEVRHRISHISVSDNSPRGICLVTGNSGQPIELCHPVIKKISKKKPRDPDPNFISFNETAFASFGKSQSANAPCSKDAVFAYTTALNYLLASERQRIQVGDASTVFWARNPCELEDDFYALIGQPKRGEEAVNYEKIRSLLSAVRTGIPPEEAEMPFYVLGLAPNASRIAVRFWYEGNVREIKKRIAEHFRDLEIVRSSFDPQFLSLFQLLLCTATGHKADNIPPNVGGELARSVLLGQPYPRTLFANAIRRCKAEQRIDFARAALIKAFLARNSRLSGTNQKEVSVALDKTYDNIGYVLGRLFAVLERIQEQAQKGLNKTIRDTYFSAASSSPLVTFRRLQDLAMHHLAKIRNTGRSTVWLDRLLGEVNDLLPPTGIPPTLSLDDQGRFAVGYYHQRQEFFQNTETEYEGGEA